MIKKLLIVVSSLAVVLILGLALYLGQTGFIAQAIAQEEVEIPFLDAWASSPHADASSEAFVHWNEESPAEVPVECAKCHSTPGHVDFLGADGSEAGAVDAPAPIGTTIECIACHNEVNLVKDSVTMPSGAVITNLGAEARCMECHQGRHSTVSVNTAIEEAGVEEDTVSPDLSFLNIHYYAAAATKYGTLAKGGYEYEGQSYDGNFMHVESFDTCIECHDPHTLEVQLEACSDCHNGVASVEDVRDIRMQGSLPDYDGDGDTEEGIYYEVDGVRTLLYQAIQAYATEVAGKSIVYDATLHPYFFIDTNDNGETDADEAAFENRFDAWTPRLLKATYNYQTSIKDPGAYVHGGKYVIQLLTDSLADLNSALSTPVEAGDIRRIDTGHFAGSEEAFRHWDVEDAGIVPADCTKCHTAEGLPMFLENGATIALPASNGLECQTCHSDLQSFDIYEVAEVEFPSGAVINSEEPTTNLCINCHQGRTSKFTVDNVTEGIDDDTVSEDIRFQNIHYFAAGATRYGTEAKGAYEYDDQEYIGYFDHVNAADTCVECHGAHELEVQLETCVDCHEGAESEDGLRAIRESEDDFDGDGNATEGIAQEIETMQEMLYAAMQTYAADQAGAPIIYSPASHPYFFIDTDGNGEVDEGEAVGDNRYATWTPRLLRAAYNYQYSTKDPGAFAHNGLYIIQVLYDSLEDIGADVSGMTRP
jgi:hypothetical protein